MRSQSANEVGARIRIGKKEVDVSNLISKRPPTLNQASANRLSVHAVDSRRRSSRKSSAQAKLKPIYPKLTSIRNSSSAEAGNNHHRLSSSGSSNNVSNNSSDRLNFKSSSIYPCLDELLSEMGGLEIESAADVFERLPCRKVEATTEPSKLKKSGDGKIIEAQTSQSPGSYFVRTNQSHAHALSSFARPKSKSPEPVERQESVDMMTDDSMERLPEVEVSPGVYKELRGSKETMDAIDTGCFALATCFCCNQQLKCVSDAELVICPDCRVVSPIEGQKKYDEQGRLRQRRGVGLGSRTSLDNQNPVFESGL